MHRCPTTIRFFLTAALTCVGVSEANAQAWVPTSQSLSFDFGYTFAFSKNHRFRDSFDFMDETTSKLPDAAMHSHIFAIGAQYVPIGNLAFRAQLPIVTSKYLDEQDVRTTHRQTPGYNVDDGNFHTSMQDLLLEARYMIDLPQIVTLTPFLSFSLPTHDYPTLGHASVGRGLWELSAGLNVGRSFPELLEGLYVHGRYQFGFVQAPEVPCRACDSDAEAPDVRPHRSIFDAELGYFVIPELAFRVNVHGIITHDGVQYPIPFEQDMRTLPQALDHDALRSERAILLGAGAAYTVLDRVVISALYQHFLSGVDTHDTSAFTLNVAFNAYTAPFEVPEYVDPFEGQYEDEE